jgi:diguanylate cyclase (GGDEF)-like protein/PAS domain S-box-containing protein
MPEPITMAGGPPAEALLEAMSEAVYAVDRKRRITYWNSAAERLTGYDAADMVGLACRDTLLNHVDDDGVELCTTGCPLLATIRDGLAHEVRLYAHHHDGHRVPVVVRAAALRSPEGAVVGAVEVFQDDSRFRALTDLLEISQQEALTDALTGIANRRMLERALDLRHYEHRRYGRGYGVVFADVDNFKQFNEHHGHDVGDQALRLVATTLRRSARAGDTAGRWGGDEFLLVAPVDDYDQALALGLRARQLVASTWVLSDGHRLAATITVGVAVAHPDEPVSELVNRASVSMLAAKTSTLAAKS